MNFLPAILLGIIFWIATYFAVGASFNSQLGTYMTGLSLGLAFGIVAAWPI